jgi:hypothetical protein
MRRNRVFGIAIAVAALATTAAVAPLAAQTHQPDLSGVWQGTLRNVPGRADAVPVDVTMEIGPLPAADSACTPWRTTYAEGGTVRQVKDYHLCRGAGVDDLFLDEGDGTRLVARWLGDVLVTPFKSGDVLLVSSIRLRGVLLEEEILTVQDRPATQGVQALVPRGIQRLVLRRRPLGLP